MYHRNLHHQQQTPDTEPMPEYNEEKVLALTSKLYEQNVKLVTKRAELDKVSQEIYSAVIEIQRLTMELSTATGNTYANGIRPMQGYPGGIPVVMHNHGQSVGQFVHPTGVGSSGIPMMNDSYGRRFDPGFSGQTNIMQNPDGSFPGGRRWPNQEQFAQEAIETTAQRYRELSGRSDEVNPTATEQGQGSTAQPSEAEYKNDLASPYIHPASYAVDPDRASAARPYAPNPTYPENDTVDPAADK